MYQPERKGKAGRKPKPRKIPDPRQKYAVVHKEREKYWIVKVERRKTFIYFKALFSHILRG